MIRTIIVAATLAAFWAGCVGGVSSERVEEPTIGRELIDLKKARDEGALDEQEYLELKQKIIDRSE